MPNFVAIKTLVTSRAERATEKFLALPFAVNVGRVEEVDAGIDRGIDDLLCAFGIDAPAEIVAAEADDGDIERPDLALFHRNEFSLFSINFPS